MGFTAPARLLFLALHSSDVSNPAKGMDVYMKWTNRVMTEFYDQVCRRSHDRRRDLGTDTAWTTDLTFCFPPFVFPVSC